MASNVRRGGKSPTITEMIQMEDVVYRGRNERGGIGGVGAALARDEAILATFGKKPQLKRRFKSLSSVGLTCSLMLCWVSLTNTLQLGLQNGGPAGLVWGFLGAFAGGTLQALVLAEVASMIPLSGGSFNWVAILAPPSCRKWLSYMAGWLNVFFYQMLVLSTCYASAAWLQSIIQMSFPAYNPQLWHAALISDLVAVFGWFTNTYLGRMLPQIESLVLFFFILSYFGVLIPVVYFGRRQTASDVFFTFLSLNGWENNSLAFLVGWITSAGVFIGADGSDHIAEEIESAAKVIPFAIWFSTVFNGILAFGMLIALLFAAQDFTAAAHSDTGFAFIQIYRDALGSTSGAVALTSVVITLNTLSATSVMATASRALWAFAREKGLPFSDALVKLGPETRLPYNALFVTVAIEFVIVLISIGSTTGIETFYSLTLSSYYSVFIVAASVVLYKRITSPSDLPWGPFRLGRAGVPITIVALIYTWVALIFSFFPSTLPVTAANMNWSILVYAAAWIVMLVFWVFHGRKVYTGPIWELNNDFRA